MTQPFELAFVGDGTSAINAGDALYKSDEYAVPLRNVATTVFGKGKKEACGRGFAYGEVGGVLGNLTESPLDGAADYHPVFKGSFPHYAAQRLGREPQQITQASRQLIGDFHAARYEDTQRLAQQKDSSLDFVSAEITNLVRAGDHFRLIDARNREVGSAHHVALALGDILSARFSRAEKLYPGQVFATPYHAVKTILANNGKDRTIVSFGTRSSFVDLVNGLANKGYQGRIKGFSQSGQTSWQAREGAELYPLHYLADGKNFRTVRDVLIALRHELQHAERKGVYVPESLIKDIGEQIFSASPQRLKWRYNLKEEAAHADQKTYHEVAMVVPWQKIYETLDNDQERKLFRNVLLDFSLYNRSNRIVPNDYREFIGHIDAGRAEINQGSFSERSLSSTKDGRLLVTLDDGHTITSDYVVNSAIGPVSAREQIATTPLLANLVKQQMIEAGEGTGFRVSEAGHGISLLGAQARRPADGIGLETNGRTIVNSWLPHVTTCIRQSLTHPQTRKVISHG